MPLPAARFARPLNADDKVVLSAVLFNAGVKARIRKLSMGFRVCFVGSQKAVIDALNNAGFLAAGGSRFNMGSFNQPHEIFVRLSAH